MIIGTKVIGLPDLFDDGDMEEQFVQVQFDDGTSVNLNEEELRNAAWKLGKLNPSLEKEGVDE